jgi:uncharacterized protein
VPLVLAGWSFGADVSLAVTDPAVGGWFAMAPVMGVVDPAEMGAAHDPRPKVLAVPEHDQFRPPGSARPVVAGWVATDLVVVPGTDHFLAGANQLLARGISDLVELLAGDAEVG